MLNFHHVVGFPDCTTNVSYSGKKYSDLDQLEVKFPDSTRPKKYFLKWSLTPEHRSGPGKFKVLICPAGHVGNSGRSSGHLISHGPIVAWATLERISLSIEGKPNYLSKQVNNCFRGPWE